MTNRSIRRIAFALVIAGTGLQIILGVGLGEYVHAANGIVGAMLFAAGYEVGRRL